jgi:cell division protein ZapA (FtsZ GTPase activity inhibitor)
MTQKSDRDLQYDPDALLSRLGDISTRLEQVAEELSTRVAELRREAQEQRLAQVADELAQRVAELRTEAQRHGGSGNALFRRPPEGD